MATRKKQNRRKKSSRRSCKHGKLKRPVRTRRGGKRKSKRKSKKPVPRPRPASSLKKPDLIEL